jgi:aspartyl aminopeptidase
VTISIGALENEGENLRHHATFLDVIAKDLGVKRENICDFELCLYDTQGGQVGGSAKEFIYAARLDNLMMSFCALDSLITSLPTQEADTCVRMISIFDNEEIGSTSLMGAESTLIEQVYRRLSGPKFNQTVRKSLLISAGTSLSFLEDSHTMHTNYIMTIHSLQTCPH